MLGPEEGREDWEGRKEGGKPAEAAPRLCAQFRPPLWAFRESQSDVISFLFHLPCIKYTVLSNSWLLFDLVVVTI